MSPPQRRAGTRDRFTRRAFLVRATGAALACVLQPRPWASAAEAGGRWVRRASLPFPRTEVSVAALDGKVYVVAGYAHGRVDQPFNQVYDPGTDTWRDLAPMPRGLNHVAVVGSRGRLYAFGGFVEQNRNPVADCFAYDVQLDRWTRTAPLPAPRGAASAVEVGGLLHVVGGRDVQSVGTHEVYDPVADRWSRRAPLPDPRDHMGLVVLEGRIHAVGGRFNTFANNLAKHHVYDPSQDRWEQRAPLPRPRSGVAAAVLRGRIYVFGGEETGRVFPDNDAYDPRLDRWLPMAPMPTPRHGTGAAAVGDWIYVPGGGLTVGGSRPSDVHEAFQP